MTMNINLLCKKNCTIEFTAGRILQDNFNELENCCKLIGKHKEPSLN